MISGLIVRLKVHLQQICLTVIASCLSCSVQAADSHDLIDQSRQLQLAANPAWLDLLHIHRGLLTTTSEIADLHFFLATDVSRNPQAEMEATLRRFAEDASMACQFPARWRWLSQYLPLGDQPVCTELDSWKQKLAAQHLTLLFPSMYLQNPASMFGHTFLRFDQAQTSSLLAYTLSYAAKPDKQDNILSFVYKGVFGGYPGVFAVQPYYQTVTDYGDIEQRDIWEYSLNLTASEIDQLLNHVWELRDQQIDYFFLRENCAYQILALLNVARPGLNLTRHQFTWYAIPVDTVRSIHDAGLMDASGYRPARASRVAQMFAQLQPPEQDAAVNCASDAECTAQICASCSDQARVLELAADIRQLNNREAALLLSQRSQINAEANWLPFANDNPLASHASARWQLAAGEHEDKHYLEIGLRPALHDWLENDAGFISGATLDVLSASVRYDIDTERLQLQQLTLFSMQSYSPVTPWATPPSTE